MSHTLRTIVLKVCDIPGVSASRRAHGLRIPGIGAISHHVAAELMRGWRLGATFGVSVLPARYPHATRTFDPG